MTVSPTIHRTPHADGLPRRRDGRDDVNFTATRSATRGALTVLCKWLDMKPVDGSLTRATACSGFEDLRLHALCDHDFRPPTLTPVCLRRDEREDGPEVSARGQQTVRAMLSRAQGNGGRTSAASGGTPRHCSVRRTARITRLGLRPTASIRWPPLLGSPYEV